MVFHALTRHGAIMTARLACCFALTSFSFVNEARAACSYASALASAVEVLELLVNVNAERVIVFCTVVEARDGSMTS